MGRLLYVVGIGPGKRDMMTREAVEALEKSELICGYSFYVDLLREAFSGDMAFSGKEYFTSPMTGEILRCRYALEKASEGITTALISSGDPGVYGMASLVLELLREYPAIEVKLIPGISASQSGGALLGAPLGHDYAVISLSDRLTAWSQIERRLRAAAEGDFALVLYNPASKGRPDALKRAAELLLSQGADPDTPCGLVRNIGREGQTVRLLSLRDLPGAECDMKTTVFVGSSRSRIEGGWMITPRGYEEKAGGKEAGKMGRQQDGKTGRQKDSTKSKKQE